MADKKLDPRTYARARVVYNEMERIRKEVESLDRLLKSKLSADLARSFSELRSNVLEVVGIVKELAQLPSVTASVQQRIDRLLVANDAMLKSVALEADRIWRLHQREEEMRRGATDKVFPEL